jgi:hypothetical protein
MFDMKSRLQTVANKEKWASRGASVMAKVKATKLVWFPPKPAQAGKDAVSAGGQAAQNTGERITGAAQGTADSATTLKTPSGS